MSQLRNLMHTGSLRRLWICHQRLSLSVCIARGSCDSGRLVLSLTQHADVCSHADDVTPLAPCSAGILTDFSVRVTSFFFIFFSLSFTPPFKASHATVESSAF